MKNELSKTFAQTIAQKIQAFDASSQRTASAIVGHVNAAREIGLLLTEWSQGQFNLTFHQSQSAQLNIPFEKLRSFVRIAARLPEPAATLDEAKAVLQLDFQTAGLLTVPEYTPPKAGTLTPFVMLTNRIGQVREVVGKMGDVIGNEERIAIKQQLKPLVEFYQTL